MITRNRPSVELFPRKYDTSGLPNRYFNPGELEAFLGLIESVKAKTVVEFGVNNGRNPAAVFKNLPLVDLYVGVDVTPDYQTKMQVQRGEIPAVPGELVLGNPKFQLIVKPKGTFELTQKDLPKADAVFIDADHSRVGVLNDYALAKQILNPGGIIMFHDDNCLPVVEVTQTLNELCENGAKIFHVKNTWIAYEMG
jgi:predicted O-methyltransferase YrrM